MDLYNTLQTVDPSHVRKTRTSIIVSHTETTRQYSVFDQNSKTVITEWIQGSGGEIGFVLEKFPPSELVVVTRFTDSEQYIVPVVPVVAPEADPAMTKTGFSQRTWMAVLTIEATPGLAYAIADENGHILNRKERQEWGITAETESEFNVMTDDMDFYSTASEGSEIRFRVPPGGRYFIVTRFPNGMTSRPAKAYQTLAATTNVRYTEYYDYRYKKIFLNVVIEPASTYSMYAVRNTETGEMTLFQRAVGGGVLLKTRTPSGDEDKLEILGKPLPLAEVSENTTSTGQVSPGRETMPPVLNKPVNGTGETQDGQSLTAGPWDSNSSPFATGKDAVEDALGSGVGQLLNPKDFSGAALAGIAVEPTTMIVLYDWEGKPSSALYYYEQQWYSAPVVDLGDGTYMVNLREGLVGYIDIAE